MKKLTLIIATTMLLCGCGKTQSDNEKETPTQPTTVTQIIDCYETGVEYSTLDAFKNSEFYSEHKANGYTPYLLEYDEERYNLTKITTDGYFYEYSLYDTTEQVTVRYSISYNSIYETIDDVRQAYFYKKNVTTTAELNGTIYDVYLLTTPYGSKENYGLFYLPFEGYDVSIYAGNSSTKEEILSYFDDFELVADN